MIFVVTIMCAPVCLMRAQAGTSAVTEEKLRSVIAGFETGNVDWNQFAPDVKQMVQKQVGRSGKIALLARLGDPTSVKAAGALDGGYLRFQVTYSDAVYDWAVLADATGHIMKFEFLPSHAGQVQPRLAGCFPSCQQLEEFAFAERERQEEQARREAMQQAVAAQQQAAASAEAAAQREALLQQQAALEAARQAAIAASQMAAASTPPPPPAPSTIAPPPPPRSTPKPRTPVRHPRPAEVALESASVDAPQSQSAVASAVVERYPNIEAPDAVSVGHEIAVQISLTEEQIAPETKIVSGEAKDGKLQLHMEGAESWTLTVNVSAPGLELARGGSNTADIKITRSGDSEIAVFYMKPKETADMPAQRDTQILASLWHGTAFLARISRPITIVAGESSAADAPAKPAVRVAAATLLPPAPPPVAMDASIVEPDLTIVESRVDNDLRLTFRSRKSTFEADIADPAALHVWIDQHYAQMARHPRGIGVRASTDASANLRGQDYLEGFGNDLFDKYAPQEFKQMLASSEIHSIQVLSDDPAIPWELMRPLAADGKSHAGFLGADHVIARWPLTQHGTMRPPQLLAVNAAVVIAPKYVGGNALDSAGEESSMLTRTYNFKVVDGTYAAVREIAKNPPQGIVHFAGHGGVDVQDGVPNFVILLQDDASIAPSTWTSLESADNANHTFYFFNACDVGESQKFMNGVDGWAPALLARGATGYIGALWPIADDTAKLFAETFYASLGKATADGHGTLLGNVFMQTRESVYQQTHDPTALAYVLYGDPMLQLIAAK